MDVRDCRTVRLPSSISRRFAERRPGSIGHITLRGKCAGARSAGKPHAACDVAGAGNGLTVRLVRHSHRKRGVLALFTVGDVYASLCKKGAYPLFSAQQRS